MRARGAVITCLIAVCIGVGIGESRKDADLTAGEAVAAPVAAPSVRASKAAPNVRAEARTVYVDYFGANGCAADFDASYRGVAPLPADWKTEAPELSGLALPSDPTQYVVLAPYAGACQRK